MQQMGDFLRLYTQRRKEQEAEPLFWLQSQLLKCHWKSAGDPYRYKLDNTGKKRQWEMKLKTVEIKKEKLKGAISSQPPTSRLASKPGKSNSRTNK